MAILCIHYVYIYIYIYIYIIHAQTKTLDSRGFDSGRILMLRGGILMPIGDFLEVTSQTILVGIVLAGKTGRMPQELATRASRASGYAPFTKTFRRRQTCDICEHATSAAAELGVEIHHVSRNRGRSQVSLQARKWHVWCLLGPKFGNLGV